jgi:glutamine---fructose-6-phosphate transaminase (isomerizing)
LSKDIGPGAWYKNEMCGIIGYIGDKNPKGILLDGLKRLEYRGYDSAGIAVLHDAKVEVFRCEGRIEALEKRLSTADFKGSLGIGHTRWATHGAPTERNAHPHQVGAITLVHNGIIENYLEHREQLIKAGRTIASDTDSEIVAHLFDIEISNGKTLVQAVKQVLPRLRGSYAFVVLSKNEPDTVLGVRNGAPLLVGVGEKENFIASDVQAILHRTKKIIYLQDQQVAVCHRGGVEIQNMRGEALPFEVKTIQWSADQMEKSGYRHFMLKEIHEQPRALAQTIETHLDHQQGLISISELKSQSDRLKNARHLHIVACGTARHAGLVGRYYIERFARIPAQVDFASEFRYRDPILTAQSIVVLISQSGETADTLAALREAKSKKAYTIAICNVRESTLAREADVVLYTNAGPEIGVASTKAFTTQLAMLYMLAVEIGQANGNLNREYSQELASDLMRLPFLTERALLLEKQIETLAEDHLDHSFFFYMGRDVQYPIALEGALKLKEISYAHAEGYAAGELKHGPIALIDRTAAVLILAPRDVASKSDLGGLAQHSETLYEKTMSNLQEVKSRGGKILAFGSENDNSLAQHCDRYVQLPATSWGLNAILMAIPLQLVAYYMALFRGTDVDKPRNLAKSVTVE